jgi:hypothetical protein
MVHGSFICNERVFAARGLAGQRRSPFRRAADPLSRDSTKLAEVKRKKSKLMSTASVFPRRLSTGISPELIFYALLLLACGLAFYLHWGLWEDQSAQVYMTWGMFHGMKPYVDLVDPNWPGILLPHALAYLLSGVDAWGLRAVDLLFLFSMLWATSWILAAWETPRSLRALVGCAYLLNYFGTGWWWTAQRESFCWPLFVVCAIPFLLQLGPRTDADVPTSGWLTWFAFGVIAGLSLWIKPVAWLPLAVLFLITPPLCERNQRTYVLRQTCVFVMGIGFISLLFVMALAFTGMLPGFIKWGILYDLGPYSQVKWPWITRLWMTLQYVVTPEFMPLPLLLSLMGCLMVGTLKLSPGRWRAHRRPMLVAAALVITGLMTALLQGKTHSLYHFLPMDWAVAFFAATIWSVIPWKKPFADAAMLLTVMAVVAMFVHGPARAGPTTGEIAADRFRPKLSPQDQIVVWGYEPSFLARLERRTPFQTFIGTSFLITSPMDSWSYREVLDRLNTALQNRSVRYLLIDQTPCFVIQKAYPYPRGYLTHDPNISATLASQYRELPGETLSGFDVLEHVPPATQPTR